MTTQTDVLRVHQLGEMLSFDGVAGLLSISQHTVQRQLSAERWPWFT